MKNYLFDGHKLMYHTDRVSEFIRKGDCYPLYMEISPVGNCNHRCIFCAYDFIGHPNRRLSTERLLKLMRELAAVKLRSVLYAGEGEPLLHPDIDRIITYTKKKGIDVGLFTNGYLLYRKRIQAILPSLTFLRFSFNAGTRESYEAVHQVKPETFDAVVDNIAFAAEYKRKKKLAVDIGIQFVLLRENAHTLMKAVTLIKEQGADYFVIKPFVKQSTLQGYKGKALLNDRSLNELFSIVEALSDEKYKVIVRRESFKEYGKRNYPHCYGTSCISVLNSAGDLATCLPYWDKKEFVFGNINTQTFKAVWKSSRRKKIKEYLEKRLDTQKCPPNCRPNAVNEFLWEITHPTVKHVNFV